MEGTLETKGYPALLMELFRGKASGVLDLRSGQMKKRLYLNRGFIRFAQSNIKVENVGGMQVAEGKLAEDQYSAAVARARAENIGVGEALATAGLLSYEAVAAATRRQVEEVCVSAFPWQEGVFKFTPGSTENVQDVRHNPLQVLLAGVKRFVSAEVARERLVALAKGTASRGADFDRELYTMRNLFTGETVTPMINGRLKVEEIVARARPQDLPLLWGLLHTTMATLSGVELGTKAAAAAPTRAFTQEEEAARALVDAEYLRIVRATDLYLVLKVPRTATGEAIKAAYLPLAKRFHADAFSGLSLGDAEAKAREVFGKLAEANATLCDPKKRADYDVLLDRKDKGLPTDLDVIFRAEAAASRADALLKQGRTGDAEAAAKEALKLDASVAQYHVTLGQAILKGRGATSASEARGCFDKALSLNPEFHTAAVYKAMALELEGEPKQAEKLLREVLLTQPENVDAARELRALKERSRKDENKGLLSKLFKR
jgi:curved DNA-binding protein CbpA